MILIRSRWLTTAQLWFDEPLGDRKADVIQYMQRSQPLGGARCTEFHTILIDLSQSPEVLLSRMTKDTRYEIRRAGDKDGITHASWASDSAEALPRFCEFFDRFAASKHLPPANGRYLSLLAEGGQLDLSCARDAEGRELVWHAYYRGATRVRLMHSASLFREAADNAFRNLVGRANRYLHWQDMLRFRNEGIRIYDLGGWYAGQTDEEKLRINKFKEEFGGGRVRNYNCVMPVTVRGRFAFALKRLLRKDR